MVLHLHPWKTIFVESIPGEGRGMRILAGSYNLNLFMCRLQRDKEGGVWCSREIARTRHENGGSFSVSFRHMCVHPITAAASLQTNFESEEIQAIYSGADHPKTIHVRFKLHKECEFGQQFLIVGDDPIIGLWDPSEGVPLNWSDGHVWTAELDIPSGKMMKYKFILKGDTGEISWQTGSDRILETWDTEKTIAVFEDWDNPELQHIVEEEDWNEELLTNSELLILAENLNHHGDMLSAPTVAETITEELWEEVSSFSDKGCGGVMSINDEKTEEVIYGNASDILSSMDEIRLVSDEGVHVLVPGLIPMLEEETEAPKLNQVVENNSVESTTLEFEEIEDLIKPETSYFSDTACPSELPTTITQLEEEEEEEEDVTAETSEMTINDDDEKRQLGGAGHMEDKILGSDMQWGRRTLQKFLANFGFSVTL